MSDADASSSKGASAPSDVGEKFECNICFDQANEPVVSLCGHLYCWPCLDRWMQSQRLPSCPVCKAGIGKDKLIPIFTRGAERANPMHSSTPRPQAQRPDSTPNPNAPPQNQFQFSIGMFGFPGFFGVHSNGFTGVNWTNLGGQPGTADSLEMQRRQEQTLSQAALFFGLFLLFIIMLY